MISEGERTALRHATSAEEVIQHISHSQRCAWDSTNRPGGMFDERLRAVFRHGAPAARAYFDHDNGFAGSTFTTLGHERSSKIATTIRGSDLLAITLLDVKLPPNGVRSLLEEKGNRKVADAFLARIHDVDIFDPSADQDLEVANAFWYWLCTIEGVGDVVSGKILARLRPRLVPIYDDVVRRVLGRSSAYWQGFRHFLMSLESAQRASFLTEVGCPPDTPFLRALDAAIWMLGSKAKRVQRLIIGTTHENGAADRQFSGEGGAFWAQFPGDCPRHWANTGITSL